MKNWLIFFVLCIASLIYSQESDYITDFRNVITTDNYQVTLSWLNSNSARYAEYMKGCPKNIVSVAYEEQRYKAMDAAIDYNTGLLSVFIESCAGGHPSTPPPIFQCVRNNDFNMVTHLFERGTPKDITWEIIGRNPENLYSYASTDEMRSFLVDNGCPTIIPVNDYIFETIDSNINVRSLPGTTSSVLYQVDSGRIGTITKVTARNANVNGNSNRWYYVTFDDMKTGWIFGQFIHVFWLDGM